MTKPAMSQLTEYLSGRYTKDRRGFYHIECPVCGALERRKKAAFFAGGWRCFRCGSGGSHCDLLKLVGLTPAERPQRPQIRPDREQKAKERQYWQNPRNAKRLLAGYLAHPKRVEAWQSYLPFTLDTINMFKLGYGVVPCTPCRHERLVYPVIQDDQILVFRGRHDGCACDKKQFKWLSAGGSSAQLWGKELVVTGCPLWVCEAPQDAMLVMQYSPDVIAVATTGGASTWRGDWSAYIAAVDPSLVIVAYDHDLQGMGGQGVRQEMIKAWLADPRHKHVPKAGGVGVLNSLLGHGIDAVPFAWADETPWGVDVGSLLASQY